ncbi:MAG: Coq4 family protein [Cyanobacteriota bacterium]|nr:Coq4 family protein [Cyanobacteriota bacterium]
MKINLKERLQSLRVVAGLAQFLKEPDRLQSVFGLFASLKGSPLLNQMERHLLAQPGLAALVAERWQPPRYTLEQLSAMPQGSLGQIYAQQLTALGLSPESLTDATPIESDGDYLRHRLRQTHDIIHILTGFGVDRDGELGVQAFNLAQNRSPLAVLLIFGGLLKSLQEDAPLDSLLRALSSGFEMGLEAKFVMGSRFEDGWERPLTEWRRELGLPE